MNSAYALCGEVGRAHIYICVWGVASPSRVELISTEPMARVEPMAGVAYIYMTQGARAHIRHAYYT